MLIALSIPLATLASSVWVMIVSENLNCNLTVCDDNEKFVGSSLYAILHLSPSISTTKGVVYRHCVVMVWVTSLKRQAPFDVPGGKLAVIRSSLAAGVRHL